jgi:hypothetical protein
MMGASYHVLAAEEESTQEKPRKHPGSTQEAPRKHPGSTHNYLSMAGIGSFKKLKSKDDQYNRLITTPMPAVVRSIKASKQAPRTVYFHT